MNLDPKSPIGKAIANAYQDCFKMLKEGINKARLGSLDDKEKSDLIIFLETFIKINLNIDEVYVTHPYYDLVTLFNSFKFDKNETSKKLLKILTKLDASLGMATANTITKFDIEYCSKCQPEVQLNTKDPVNRFSAKMF